MPPGRVGKSVYDLFTECNDDLFLCAEKMGMPEGWQAKSGPRPSDPNCYDLCFTSPTGQKCRSIKQILDATGEAYFPDFLRVWNKMPLMSPAEKVVAYGNPKWPDGGRKPKAAGASAPAAAPSQAAATPAPAASSPRGAKRSAADMTAELTAAAKGPAAKAEPGPAATASWPPAGLDSEMEGEIARGEQADGFALARKSESFLVQPDDVIQIADLDALAAKILASGWRAKSGESGSKRSRIFVGKADVALYAHEGRLLVRTDDRALASRVARLYVDLWLLA